MFTKGTGLNKNDLKEKKKESAPEAPVDFNQFEPVDHGNSRAPPEEVPVSHAQVHSYMCMHVHTGKASDDFTSKCVCSNFVLVCCIHRRPMLMNRTSTHICASTHAHAPAGTPYTCSLLHAHTGGHLFR